MEILAEVFDKNAYVNKTVEAHLKRYPGMGKADRGFVTRLATGTAERLITLDYVIGLYSDMPVHKQKPLIRNILRMTAYQLLYMDVSDYAACDEAVKLTRRKGKGALSGFVNAISRKIAKNKDRVFDALDRTDEAEALKIRYSMPDYITRLFLESFSKEDVTRAFEYFLEENRTSVRCNRSKTDPEALKESLLKSGAKVTEGRCTPGCFKIEGYDTLLSLRAFAEGECQVQDESSALVGTLAGIRAGDTVLDICAAPGGKTIHAADILKYKENCGSRADIIHGDNDHGSDCAPGSDNSDAGRTGGAPGRVISCDISEKKLSLIRENILRCGFDNIEVKINDAEEYREDFFESADVVLADLPCSGLGIIGKKPDIKYRVDEEKVRELSGLQKRMLVNAAKYVKPGGTLVFSTCTLTKQEDEENADYIVKELGLEPAPFDDVLPDHLRTEKDKWMIKLLPGKYGTDGFFIARFKKPL